MQCSWRTAVRTRHYRTSLFAVGSFLGQTACATTLTFKNVKLIWFPFCSLSERRSVSARMPARSFGSSVQSHQPRLYVFQSAFVRPEWPFYMVSVANLPTSISCNHNRALALAIEVLDPTCLHHSYACENYTSFKEGTCDPEPDGQMSVFHSHTPSPLPHYLVTKDVTGYCGNQKGCQRFVVDKKKSGFFSQCTESHRAVISQFASHIWKYFC